MNSLSVLKDAAGFLPMNEGRRLQKQKRGTVECLLECSDLIQMLGEDQMLKSFRVKERAGTESRNYTACVSASLCLHQQTWARLHVLAWL